MPDDSLGNALRLSLRTVVLLEHVQSEVPAEELERQEGAVRMLVYGADVVEQAREEPGFIAELPIGELLAGDCEAWRC